ncbi:hypothetical protein Tco_0216560 [Tanacetum coccineum]
MTVTPVLETIQETQENPTENVTETPPATPPTRTKKKRAKTLLKKAIKTINWKKAVIQRLTNLKQGNHTESIKESIQANVINEVKNQLLPKAVYTLSEYELKHKLYDMMQKIHSVLAHDKHLKLYNALMNSMAVNESAAKGDLNHTPSQHKRSYDGQDPPKDLKGEKVGREGEKMLERAKELRVQSWFNELVDAEEEPKENELINGLVVLFGKCMKKFVKNDKITCNIPKLGRSGIWVGDGTS